MRLLAFLLACSLPSTALAQWDRETSPVDLPGYSVTTPDTPEAVNLNPSALAFLPSWGLAYVHADTAEGGQRRGNGDGFYAASPLFFGFAAGLAVDSIRPTLGVPENAERTMVSLALAWGLQDALSVGAALRFLASGDVRFDGVTTLDLSASWRPVDWLALSFLARDVVGPRLGGTLESVPRSFLLGAALRPFGSRVLSLDFAGALDEDGRVGARAAAEATVPYVGRLIAAAELSRLDGPDPAVRVTGGVAVDWGQVGVGGGVAVGDGLEAAPGWYASARLEGAQREGLPRGSYVLDVELGGLGARGIVYVVRRLERALYDERVRGVYLRPRGSGIGLAYAQEIRMLVDQLREAGKPVVCHLDDAAGSEWYACAGADRILLDPAGGVRLTGVSSELMHFGEVLRDLGVRADFVRIGAWKSATEQFLNDAQTAPARAQTESILDLAYRRLVFDAAGDQEMSRADLRALIDRGPLLPQQALDAGVVHALADENDLDDELREAFGGSFPRERGAPWEVPERWGHRPQIGVVVIDGTMVDGENVDIPLLGLHFSGGRTVSRAIDRLAADPSVRAIVIRVDSGGGSVMAADQIYRAISRARRRKPVIASLGAVAASGGYYVASACHEIWADPSTITGSIGIWFGKVDFAPLGEEIGVSLEQVGRGQHAGATSLYRAFTPEERHALSENVREWYRMFLRRVARGRGMRVAEVDAVGRGRIWMGDQAIDNGLVDHLGGVGSALAAARRAAGVGPEVGIRLEPDRPATLLDYALSLLGIGASPIDPVGLETQDAVLARVAPELRATVSAATTLRLLGSGSAMALMPNAVVPR